MNRDENTISGQEATKQDLIKEIRNGETGRSLTASQFGEAWSIAGIMHHTIRKTGAFKDKLTDYAHAFARSERFDALLGETNVRNIFAERYGETMNDMRERLATNYEQLADGDRIKALNAAMAIEPAIVQSQTTPFYKAYDEAARNVASTLDINEASAKQLMKETYAESTGKDLYEVCKAAEHEHYRAPHTEQRNAVRGRSGANGQQRQRRRA